MGDVVIAAADVLVWAIVACAVAYLLWKLAFANRTPRRKRIDVAANQLVRKTSKRGSGCH